MTVVAHGAEHSLPEADAAALQSDDWSWLARDLPRLQILELTDACIGINTPWPAALADCTGLECLVLVGSAAGPIPGGRYLEGLKRLDWVGDSRAALPQTLAAATALEELTLGHEPERVIGCGVLEALPSLRLLSFVVQRDAPNPANAV